MRFRAGVVLVVLALLVAACSDGDGNGSSKTEEQGSAPGAVAAKPSVGCDVSPASPPGEETLTMTSSGATRTYIRHVPPAYAPPEPLPVILDFHGSVETAEVHADNSRLGAYGDEQGFVTITPQGQGTGADSFWDTAYESGEIESVDVTFVGDLLDEVERTLCVDEQRVFATGYSNGAFLDSAIACVYSDRFAAIGTVAGLRDLENCEPSRAVPIVTFHGTGDEWLAFEGGLGPEALAVPPDSQGRELGEKTGVPDEGPPVPDIVAAWAARNGCDEEPEEEEVASDVTLVRYSCPAGADVDFYRIEGGGHTWPGSEFTANLESILGTTTFSISANEVMWEFFERHALPE